MLETVPLLQTVVERLSSALHVPKVAFLVAQNGGFEPAFALGYDALPRFGSSNRTARSLSWSVGSDRCACAVRMRLPGSTMSAPRNAGSWNALKRRSSFLWREGIDCWASSASGTNVPRSRTPRPTFGSSLLSPLRPV